MRKTLTALAVLLAFVLAPSAGAKTVTLHPGSTGPRVADLQWLLSGHRPNVFTKVKPTLVHYTRGTFGTAAGRTGSAVFAYKYRLGYPAKYNSKTHPIAGPYFFNLLLGHTPWKVSWAALASTRLKAVEPGATAWALKVKAYEVTQLGVMEVGDNSGRQVNIYQSATGAYNAAWCASFQQYAFLHVGYGTIADRSAGVFYIERYARDHHLVKGHPGSTAVWAKPKVGRLVAFMDGQGHIGYVVKVTASGFSYIAGNDGNGVHERFLNLGARPTAFLSWPGF